MTNILLIDENHETNNLLFKSLETAGFEVIRTENGLICVHLEKDKLSTTKECKKLNNPQSIFPSIPRLRKLNPYFHPFPGYVKSLNL